MSELVAGTGSGEGPQSGGFMMADSTRGDAYRNALASRATMEAMLRDTAAWRNAQRVLGPSIGGSSLAAQNDFLYRTKMGAVAQVGLGAIATHGISGGGGNYMDMAAGLSNFVGRTQGGYRDYTGGNGGAFRQVVGAGFATDQAAKNLWSGLNDSFYGANGTQNRVSGLNPSQVGQLMSALSTSGAMYGRSHTTMRQAKNLDEQIAIGIAQAKVAAPDLVSRMSGLNASNFDQRLADASDPVTGDKRLKDTLLRTKRATTVFEKDETYSKDLSTLVKSSAALATTLGDIFGSKDMGKMLQTAKAITGSIIRTTQEARQAKTQIDQAVAFAQNNGIDPRSYLQQSVSQAAAANQMLTQGLGIDSPALAAKLGQSSLRHGVSVGLAEGINGGYSGEQASAMRLVGVSERIKENPQIVAALKKLEYGNLNGQQKSELQGLVNNFRNAATPAQMQAEQAKMERYFQKNFGKGSYESIGGEAGLKSAMEDSKLAGQLDSVMSDNVSNSVISAGAERAWDEMSIESKKAMGSSGTKTGEILVSSLQDKTRRELFDLMEKGDEAGVAKLLKSKAGLLKDASGNEITPEAMITMLKGTGGLKNTSGALKSLVTTMSGIDSVKASTSRELEANQNAMQLQKSMETAGVMSDAVRDSGKTWSQLALTGFFTGEDGRMTPTAVAQIALEKKKAGDTRTAEVLGMKEGKLTASAGQLSALLKGKDASALFAATGAKNAGELSAKLGADTSGNVSKRLQAFLGENYNTQGLGNDQYAVIDRDFTTDVEDTYTDKGRLAKMGELAGGGNFLKDPKSTQDISEYAGSLINKFKGADDQHNLIQRAAKGDAEALGKLQEIDKASGGTFKSALDADLVSVQNQLKLTKAGGKNLTEAEKNAQDDLVEQEKYLKETKKKLDEGPTEDKVMNVGTLIVQNYTPPSPTKSS